MVVAGNSVGGDDNGGSNDRGGVAAPETADDGAETGDMVAPATPQRAALATPHAERCGNSPTSNASRKRPRDDSGGNGGNGGGGGGDGDGDGDGHPNTPLPHPTLTPHTHTPHNPSSHRALNYGGGGDDSAASLEATPQGEAAVAAASAWLQPLGRKQQEPGGAATAGTAPGEAAQPRKKNKRGKRSGSQAGQTHDERRAESRGGGSSRS